MRDFLHNYDPIFFVSHIDGDCLNNAEGRLTDKALYITVKVKALETSVITINGIDAVYDEETHTFSAEIPLYTYRNTLCAIDSKNGYREEIVVFWLKKADKKFYFTVDDCVIFLMDITKDADKYNSIFEHHFLAPFKKAHDLYGTNVHLNLYYEFNEEFAKDFSEHKDYFNLSMVTDKFKKEWEENADWLTLSYHAHSNYPDMPHKVQSAPFIAESIRKTHKEIIRFAGEKSLISATTAHWGNGYIEQLRAFRENGYKLMFASFRQIDTDEAYLSYLGRDGLPSHIRGTGRDAYNKISDSKDGNPGRDLWKDTKEDIYFCRTSMMLNNVKGIPSDMIEQWLDEYLINHSNIGVVQLLIHEEYFYEDYRRYISDCGERVLKAIKHIYDKGYRSCPIEEIVFEK